MKEEAVEKKTDKIEDDIIIGGIKEGRLIPIYIEPLKEMTLNLKFCPQREECKQLQDRLNEDILNAETLVENISCDFCNSDKWLFVGATSDGNIMESLLTKGYGEKVKEVVEEWRNQFKSQIEPIQISIISKRNRVHLPPGLIKHHNIESEDVVVWGLKKDNKEAPYSIMHVFKPEDIKERKLKKKKNKK